MADVLAFGEQRDGQLGGAAREVVGVAASLADDLGGSAHALVLGGPGTSASAESLGQYGAASIAVGEHEALSEYNPEGYVGPVVQYIREGGYEAVVFPATTLLDPG